LLNADGQAHKGVAAVDCKELQGDTLSGEVKWDDNSNVAQHAGQPIRMRFVLKNAEVFAFRFQ